METINAVIYLGAMLSGLGCLLIAFRREIAFWLEEWLRRRKER